ncbi:MAG: hypothetical protein M0C28_12840 [Candidatus Moduliflexus flocculans]|nr:hypothetical protein [Candidatus Moduliflexus flocculans]
MRRHLLVRPLVDRPPARLRRARDACAQEKLDLQMLDRIRAEGLSNSKISDLLIYLCDVYAPRLPASPQYVQAGEWVVGKAKELGLANAAMEPYGTFGRSWELQKYYAAMTAPQYMPIIGYPKAWTPGTNGVAQGPGRPAHGQDRRRPRSSTRASSRTPSS